MDDPILPVDATLISDYLSHLTYRGRSKATVKRRRISIGTFARWMMPMSLVDVTLEDIERWASGYERPATRKAYTGDLREFYRWAVKRGRMTVDPTVDLEGVAVPQVEARPVPRAAVVTLLAAARSRETRLALALAAYAGLRVSEISALCAEDVDLEGRGLRVGTSKMGHGRRVPISDELAAVLVDLPPGRLFPLTDPRHVARRIQRVMNRCGLGDYHPHNLRASFATEASKRLPLWTLRLVLGHSDMATTQRYVLPDPADAAALNGLYSAPAQRDASVLDLDALTGLAARSAGVLARIDVGQPVAHDEIRALEADVHVLSDQLLAVLTAATGGRPHASGTDREMSEGLRETIAALTGVGEAGWRWDESPAGIDSQCEWFTNDALERGVDPDEIAAAVADMRRSSTT